MFLIRNMVESLGFEMKSLIEKAIILFKNRKLKKQIKNVSKKVRDESLKITKEFDDTIYDGLIK